MAVVVTGTFRASLDPDLGGSDLAAFRDALRGWLRAVGMVQPALHNLLLAAGEACTNAVEHSGARVSGTRPAVWIEASCQDDRVRIVVSDRGEWKVPERAPDSQPSVRGRGRLLMTALVDQVEISTAATGTTVLLVKAIPGAPGGTQDIAPGPGPRLRVDRIGPGEVAVIGEIDMANARQFRAELESARVEGTALVVDLRGVTHLSSSGVSVLFEQARERLLVRTAAGSTVAGVLRNCALPLLADVEYVAPGAS
jgi:anti-sigma regulatory factor (Ser/Thr protein kinase)